MVWMVAVRGCTVTSCDRHEVAKVGVTKKGDASGAVCTVGTTGVKWMSDSTLSRYTSNPIKRGAEPTPYDDILETEGWRMAKRDGKMGAETEVSMGALAVPSMAHDTRKVADKCTRTKDTYSAEKTGGKSGYP